MDLKGLMKSFDFRRRMQGYKVLWVPGCDHAGIATQVSLCTYICSGGIGEWKNGENEIEIEIVSRCKQKKHRNATFKPLFHDLTFYIQSFLSRIVNLINIQNINI